MSDTPNLCEEAAAALIDFGLHLVPVGDDLAVWQVGGMTFTADELLALARQFGLVEKRCGRPGEP